MNVLDYVSALLLVAGGGFFFAGTLGLLRFPDVYSRLHALSKADNVGLGLIVTGLALQAGSFAVFGKLLMIWVFVMLSGACVSHLVAQRALEKEIPVWKR